MQQRLGQRQAWKLQKNKDYVKSYSRNAGIEGCENVWNAVGVSSFKDSSDLLSCSEGKDTAKGHSWEDHLAPSLKIVLFCIIIFLLTFCYFFNIKII